MVTAAADMVGIPFPKVKRFPTVLNLKILKVTRSLGYEVSFSVVFGIISGKIKEVTLRCRISGGGGGGS